MNRCADHSSFNRYANIKDLLVDWAKTRRSHRVGTEYPNSSCFCPAISTGYLSALSETEATVIDDAVLLLRKYDVHVYEILKSCYLYNMSCNKVSKIVCKSTSYVAMTLREAEAYVAGRIGFTK